MNIAITCIHETSPTPPDYRREQIHMLKIVTYPNKILRKKAQAIENILDTKIQELAQEMVEIMKKEQRHRSSCSSNRKIYKINYH